MTEPSSLFHALHRAASDWFVSWWMGRVAGRYCPCEWPIKSKRLMHWCGRIDDAYDRLEFRRFCAFWSTRSFPLSQTVTTTASNFTGTITYTNPPRKRHGDKP